MPAPRNYVRGYSFAGYQATNPNRPLPGPALDNELEEIEQSLTEAISGLNDIRRADGQLKNGIVGVDALAPDIITGVRPATLWQAGIQYQAQDTVSYLAAFYRCTINHLSTDFLTDLTATRWELYADIGGTATDAQIARNEAVAARNEAVPAGAAATAGSNNVTALYDLFDDRYLGEKTVLPLVDNDGNAIVDGALVSLTGQTPTTLNGMYVRRGGLWHYVVAPFLGAFAAYRYVATAAQTVITGADANGGTLAYTPGAIMVTVNGVTLAPNTYTATNGTSVVLGTALSVSDAVVIHSFGSFSVANAESAPFTPAGAGAVPRTIQSKLRETVSIMDFGAANDGVTPDDAAFDLAYAWCMSLPNGGTIVFPAGAGYRLNSSHNIFPTKPLALDFRKGSKVLCGLSGAANAMFDATHPVTPGTRGQSLTIRGSSYFDFHASVTPGVVGAMFLKYRYASDFKIEGADHTWLHYRDNAQISLSALWNCDLGGIAVWGGGVRKSKKSTGSITFSITAASTTLTASASVFDASDVGDIIVVEDEVFTIASFASGTSVTTTKAATKTHTSDRASYGAVRCNAVAGNATITLDASVAVAGDVGRVVYIIGASTEFGSGTPLKAHRATITVVGSGTSITLDEAPTASISNAEIIFSPAVEVFYDTDPYNGQPNDYVWRDLEIEAHRGTGLVLGGGVNVFLPNLKIHAQNGFYNEVASDYSFVSSNTSVSIPEAQFEGITTGRLGRSVVCGSDGLTKIGTVLGYGVRGQALLHAWNMSSSGVVVAGDWHLAATVDVETAAQAFRITGSGKLRTGNVTSYVVDVDYPTVQAGPRPPASLYPSRTLISSTSNGNSFNLGVSTSTFSLGGIAVGGTIEEPTAALDFQSAVKLVGFAKPPTGAAAIEIGGLRLIARSPSGANVSSDWILSTRNGATLADRWIVAADGHILPVADWTYTLGNQTNRLAVVSTVQISLGTGTTHTSGAGTPEGFVTAIVGSTYGRTDGGAGTSFYVKESGSGNTGWVAK
jgi:hypothetical protein